MSRRKTTQDIKDPSGLTDEFFKEFNVLVIPRDVKWLLEQVHSSPQAARMYADFLATHIHPMRVTEENVVVQDFASDPRVFVFLRQQMQVSGSSDELRDSLVDSLILFALEGTDPDKHILRNVDEILHQVTRATKFEVSSIRDLVRRRLNALATAKPKQIRHHTKEHSYCLPYETRLHLEESRILDELIFKDFNESVAARFETHASAQNLSRRHCEQVLTRSICELFKRQGLDFANFLLQKQEEAYFEVAISDIIEKAALDIGVAAPNLKATQAVVQDVLRELIYQGSTREREYLRRLSKTFMLALRASVTTPLGRASRRLRIGLSTEGPATLASRSQK